MNLFIHTHRLRRAEVLNNENISTQSILQKYPMLKKSSYISHMYVFILQDYLCAFAGKTVFDFTTQRPKLKNEFDEELVLWSKAVVGYCKKTCKN